MSTKQLINQLKKIMYRKADSSNHIREAVFSELVDHRGFCTCMSSTNVVLHVVLLHAGIVTDAAAEREHPLLLVHMERHVADKLGVQLRLEIAHMAAGQRTERKRKEDGENNRGETVSFSVILCLHKLVSGTSVDRVLLIC